MDAFIAQLEAWFLTASGYVDRIVELLQRYTLIAVIILVIGAGFGHLLGFISLRFLERMRAEWGGSVVVGLFLIFGIGTILRALLPG